jgi:hypothetical protein
VVHAASDVDVVGAAFRCDASNAMAETFIAFLEHKQVSQREFARSSIFLASNNATAA